MTTALYVSNKRKQMKPSNMTSITAIIYDSYTESDGNQTTRVVIPKDLWGEGLPRQPIGGIKTGYTLVGYSVKRRWAVIVVDCLLDNGQYRHAIAYNLSIPTHRMDFEQFIENIRHPTPDKEQILPTKVIETIARHRANVSAIRSNIGRKSAFSRFGTDIGTRTIRVYTADVERLQTIAKARGIRIAELIRTFLSNLEA